MNIFIDTNILYDDYFFEAKSNKQILEYAQKGLIDLYISEIVILELRRHYQKELEEKNAGLKKLIKDAGRLKIESDFTPIDLKVQLEIFDDFYKNTNLDYEHIHRVGYRNDFLPNIVDRAIHRKKPFTETKTELKDAIIWLSYAQCAESKNLFDCILLTGNTSDFCDKKDNSKIHEELCIESNKFIVINKAFNFIRKYSSEIVEPEIRFEKYFKSLKINNSTVHNVICENFADDIKTAIHKKLDRISIDSILPRNYYYIGDEQIVGYDIEILEEEEIKYKITGTRAIISGSISVSCDTEILRYNSDRDEGEDSFISVADKILFFSVDFNFDLEEDEKYKDFEITKIELSYVD